MRVFQHRRRGADGRACKDRRWTIETKVRDAVVRLPGFLDRAATEELGRLVDQLDGLRGVRPNAALAARLEALSQEVRERLAKLGLIDLSRLAGARPLTEHVEAFRASLVARGSTAAHTATTCRRVLQVFAGIGAVYWSEIRPDAVERFLHKLRTDGAPTLTPKGTARKARPISAKSSNYALRDVRAFCTWMVANGFAEEHPLRSLRAVAALPTYERATLSPEELQALIATTAASGVERYGAPAVERSWIYRICAEIGARPNREARNLRIGDLVLEGDAPTVTLQAAHAKAKRTDTVPLKLATARALAAFLGGRTSFPSAAVFPNMPSKYKLAAMLREDCAAAGIELPADPNLRLDFYGATRHSFVSNLNAAHVDPATMRALARHADVGTTLKHYVHGCATDRTRAVEALPDLGAPVLPATLKRAAGDGVVARGDSDAETVRGTVRLSAPDAETLESSGFSALLRAAAMDFESIASASSATPAPRASRR